MSAEVQTADRRTIMPITNDNATLRQPNRKCVRPGSGLSCSVLGMCFCACFAYGGGSCPFMPAAVSQSLKSTHFHSLDAGRASTACVFVSPFPSLLFVPIDFRKFAAPFAVPMSHENGQIGSAEKRKIFSFSAASAVSASAELRLVS